MLLQTNQKLEDTNLQMEEAKKEVEKPFDYEDRLAEFSARQTEINTKLEFKELRQQEEVILDEGKPENSKSALITITMESELSVVEIGI